jgi:hypothetical protein
VALADQLMAMGPPLLAGTWMLAGVEGASSTVVTSVLLHGPQPPTLHACTR